MDSAILSATAALFGSLIGGASTLAASWLTQRGQLRAQALIHEAVKREVLYAEFISEASRRSHRCLEPSGREPGGCRWSLFADPQDTPDLVG
jgi:hypothetical protein